MPQQINCCSNSYQQQIAVCLNYLVLKFRTRLWTLHYLTTPKNVFSAISAQLVFAHKLFQRTTLNKIDQITVIVASKQKGLAWPKKNY